MKKMNQPPQTHLLKNLVVLPSLKNEFIMHATIMEWIQLFLIGSNTEFWYYVGIGPLQVLITKCS